MKVVLLCVLASFFAGWGTAEADSAASLAAAYQALQAKNYDEAIAAFRHALSTDGKTAAPHKDLAYTLLKVGESREARDEFEKAMKLDPHDESAALEYAFLCYETRKPVEARRVFDRLRQHGLNSATRATAARAFENIDKPLAAGIARWQQALAGMRNPLDASTYSAHWELGQLAEYRDNLPLAAEQYEICRRLKPQQPSLFIDLARIWQQLNEVEQAHAALLAASRSTESRTAETALELWGSRYPYVYEFQNAVKLDPKNAPLRRELAYLLLTLHKEADAIREFEQVLAIAPDDRLALAQLAALRNSLAVPGSAAPERSPSKPDPKAMGKKSLAAGFVNDAIRYLNIAHENDPDDAEVMLQLGWAFNIARNDREAIHWFDAARHSSNSVVAREAQRAWKNLRGDAAQTTVWALPLYSSRWNDTFLYGQVKKNLPLTLSHFPVHWYLSARFVGDVRGKATVGTMPPQYLSETSVIAGFGVATKSWHHLLGWAEAGEAFSYHFARSFGHPLGSRQMGSFFETTADAIYVHRFDRNTLFYSRNRPGYTFHLGSDSLQLYRNGNYVRDLQSQPWANYLEFGPGVRFHIPGTPPGVYLSADWLHGVYTIRDNPSGPRFNDLRLSFWYAASR